MLRIAFALACVSYTRLLTSANRLQRKPCKETKQPLILIKVDERLLPGSIKSSLNNLKLLAQLLSKCHSVDAFSPVSQGTSFSAGKPTLASEHAGAAGHVLFPSFPRQAHLRFATPVASELPPGEQAVELQKKLDDAVSREDYETAAQLQKQIKDLLLDDELAVRRANQAFYEAFSTGDADAMAKLWALDGAVCVHPSTTVFRGHAAIIQSWKEIFSAATLEITAEKVDVMMLPGGLSAVVTCVERVQGERAVPLFGSNVFKKDSEGQWRMVLHHANVAADTSDM